MVNRMSPAVRWKGKTPPSRYKSSVAAFCCNRPPRGYPPHPYTVRSQSQKHTRKRCRTGMPWTRSSAPLRLPRSARSQRGRRYWKEQPWKAGAARFPLRQARQCSKSVSTFSHSMQALYPAPHTACATSFNSTRVSSY